MLPKERLIRTLHAQSVDRVPTFCGFYDTVTVECMEAAGVYWPSAHKDPEKMAKLSASVYTQTGLEVAAVPYCLTVEAEALGCEIEWSDKSDAVPRVLRTPYTSYNEVKFPKDFLNLRRVSVVLKAIEILKNEVGGVLPVAAGLTGPFTLAGHLSGVGSLLRRTKLDPDQVRGFVEVASEVGAIYGKALGDAGADIVIIADPVASCNMVSPVVFTGIVKPAITKIVKAIDVFAFLHICGNVNPILAEMAETGVVSISIDEHVDVAHAKALLGDRVKIAGNISPIDTLFLKKPAAIKEVCRKTLEAGVDILAPGCGVVPTTPNLNIRALVEAARVFKPAIGLHDSSSSNRKEL